PSSSADPPPSWRRLRPAWWSLVIRPHPYAPSASAPPEEPREAERSEAGRQRHRRRPGRDLRGRDDRGGRHLCRLRQRGADGGGGRLRECARDRGPLLRLHAGPDDHRARTRPDLARPQRCAPARAEVVSYGQAVQGWHDLYVTAGAAAATRVGLRVVGRLLDICESLYRLRCRDVCVVTL